MERIWAVSSGSYSDYCVMAICETKEDADRYAEVHNSQANSRYGEDFRVEEFDYYPAGELPAIITYWRAQGRPGEDISVTQREGFVGGSGTPHERRVNTGDYPYPRESAPRRFPGSPYSPAEYLYWADARDRDAAIKSVKDRCSAALAHPVA